MRRFRLVFALVPAALLFSAAANGDALGPGEKGIGLSIRVDGTLPVGKALVLHHTFRHADALPVGQVAKVDWHPYRGPMQLVLIDAADAARVNVVREEVKVLNEMLGKGMLCGAPFEGVRTLPETSPADEVRWIYSVRADATSCNAALIRTEMLGKNGEVLESQPAPSSSGAGGAPQSSSASTAMSGAPPSRTALATPLPPSSASTAPAGAASGGCGACAVGGTSGSPSERGGALVLLALLGSWLTRRRSR